MPIETYCAFATSFYWLHMFSRSIYLIPLTIVTSLSSGSRTSGCNKTPSRAGLMPLRATLSRLISTHCPTFPRNPLFSLVHPRVRFLAVSLFLRVPVCLLFPSLSLLEILSRPSFFLHVSFYLDHREARATCSCQSQSRAGRCRVRALSERYATATFKSS